MDEEPDMVTHNVTWNHSRAPKSVPDLKLAESYIAGALTWVKGMFYVGLCLSIGNYDADTLQQYYGIMIALRLLPFALLYYDHLLVWKVAQHVPFDISFIDSTSLCIDVVAGTVACQVSHLDFSCTSFLCNILSLSWTIFSAVHLFYVTNSENTAYQHGMVLLFVLSIMVFSRPTVEGEIPVVRNISAGKMAVITTKLEGFIKVQGSILPYLFRSASYLGLCIVDIYFLRSPYQRERDRIGMMKYGSILFSPSVLVLLSVSIMTSTLFLKIYINNQNTGTKKDPEQGEKPPSKIIRKPTVQSALANTGHINFNELDPNEAFKLAKMHCLENKATS